jgi:hypothetical protein
MSEATREGEDWSERANDLYWSSDRTVDAIVDDLGVSRSALYASLEPAPAGLICTDCQERMTYANRTARDRGIATCPSCGRESDEGEPEAGVTRVGRQEGGIGAWTRNGWSSGRLDRWGVDLAAVPPERVAMVGGAAALGMVIGAVAARAVRGH